MTVSGDWLLFLALVVLLVIAGAVSVYALFRLRGCRRSARYLMSALEHGDDDAYLSADRTRLSEEHRRILDTFQHRLVGLRDRVAGAERDSDAALSILSRVGDGVLVTDARGNIVLANRSQLERLRLSEQRVIGRSLIEVTQDHEVHHVVQECIASGVEQRALIETEPGRRFVSVSAMPSGVDGGCVVVFQDRTELRRLEKVRRDFVANISHELRTPLTTLKLLCETLSDGGLDDTAVLAEYLSRIGVEVDRLAQMVEELGELSRIESGQARLERTPVRVSDLVARAIERLSAQAVRSELRLELDVAEDLPEPLGDERRLEQVLVNLLHNAIKFTAVGGAVSVRAEQSGDEILLTVEDNGIGIPEEDLDRIFERFYKTDKSRSSSGTGLGLAIARHVVDLHGGRIWVQSIEGRGSRFTFTLPLSSTQQ